METFRKQNRQVPARVFGWEAAGLEWLRSAEDGVPVVEVVGLGEHHLDLVELRSVAPSARAARDLGAALARTHDAGAAGFGAGPEGWEGDGYFGPLDHPMPLSLRPEPSWGRFYAEQRLRPALRWADQRGVFDRRERALFDSLGEDLARGDYDDGDRPARLHGDLWSGNVMWTPGGVTLIDPSAHGGHRESDLAMLDLFGLPYLDDVLTGYLSVHPLREGWRERIGLHQLFPLLMHAVLFGGGYGSQAVRVARRYARG